MTHALIEFDHVTKVYDDGTQANRDVSFAVSAGEVFGLLGPNGAGKSTIVNQLVGLVKPTTGVVTVGGCDVAAEPNAARARCAVQPQTQVPIEGLTARQFVEFVARLRGATRDQARTGTATLLDAVDISEWADRPAEKLSGGVLRLAAFCAAAVVPTAAVVLDEPTNDVDPLRRRLLWRQVRHLAHAGRAVLLVTHNVAEAEHAVDRVAILNQGSVIATGRPSELKKNLSGHLRLAVRFSNASAPEPPVGRPIVKEDGYAVYALAVGEASRASSWAIALSEQQVIDEFAIGPATLEDAYADHLEVLQAADR